MAEKKKLSTELPPEEFEAKRAELSAAVREAEKALWDHTHPVIEDPQVVADQEAAEARKAERAKAAKK